MYNQNCDKKEDTKQSENMRKK